MNNTEYGISFDALYTVALCDAVFPILQPSVKGTPMQHDEAPAPYNPAADYTRVMSWTKYGVLISVAVILLLRFTIG